MKFPKAIRTATGVAGVVFLLMNAIAATHAYKFSHFSIGGKRNEQLELSFLAKVRLVFTGVDNPRPVNTLKPEVPYTTVAIKSNVLLSCWMIPTRQTAKGTVILFHGYTSDKSQLLPRAMPLVDSGYNCLLVDFMGSGGSGGNSTTIGYKEAEEVKDCFEYVKSTGEQKIFLLGSSMGAVAIMKAMKDYGIQPRAAVLECPFATMYETVAIRFKMLNAPEYPMAAMLVFYGGLLNGFWGFSHNPEEYAGSTTCPVLLQYGAHDDRVAEQEIMRIKSRIPTKVTLTCYQRAGHDNYLETCHDEWCANVARYLNSQ